MALELLRGCGVLVRVTAAALVVGGFAVSSAAPVFARGGGPANIINSEGYQRALRAERQQYQQAQPQMVTPVSMPKHRHHRHRS